MSWLKSVASEILGLFVDDGSFAIAILVWAAIVVFVLARVTGHASWMGPTLFSGLAFILIENVVRFSRRRPR